MYGELLKKLRKKISHRYFLESRYEERWQKKLDLRHPDGSFDFNEKILWLILFYKNPLLCICADKYRARGYVESLGLGHLLTKLYGIYKSAGQIDWNVLPQKVAIKCNHGCGYNIICDDLNALDKEAAAAKLKAWLREDFGKKFFEPQYMKIRRRIICEEYIEADTGLLPPDYKFYCFNGTPKVVLYCFDRETNLRLEWYDLDWNPLELGLASNERHAGKPPCLDKMIEYAARLSAPFPFVRVDFFVKNGQPVFSEMTFTPAYGMAEYYNPEGNAYLGSLLELPNRRSYKKQNERGALK
jgi:hypothetical protein